MITPAAPKAALAALAAALALAPACNKDALEDTGVRGAGSTFAYPMLSRWSMDYRVAQARAGEHPVANAGLEDPLPTTTLDYEPVGSLAGTLRLESRAVDFAATDMPLSTSELDQRGLIQFPIVVGGVVIAVNVSGLEANRLKLTGSLLADIYLGAITRWSDPALAAVNPGLTLPDDAIQVVRRSDGSGTTFNFTTYVSRVSPTWRERVGAGLEVAWPVGTAARGSEGVAHAVAQLDGSIGYVEYAQARALALATAQIQNSAGEFVTPGPDGFAAAARNADWQPTRDFEVVLSDMPGDDAYPITATVFAQMRRDAPYPRTRATLDFFAWSFMNGGEVAVALGYVPLPSSVVEQIHAYWSTELGHRP